MSDLGVLVMELSSGLSFPATEYLSRVVHSQALQGKYMLIGHVLVLALSDSSFHSLSPFSSSSVSSAVGGSGLSPCQHHRFLGGVRAPGPDEAVQTPKGGAGLLQIAGDSLGSHRCPVLIENIARLRLGDLH